jgi:hypothetical protein
MEAMLSESKLKGKKAEANDGVCTFFKEKLEK